MRLLIAVGADGMRTKCKILCIEGKHHFASPKYLLLLDSVLEGNPTRLVACQKLINIGPICIAHSHILFCPTLGFHDPWIKNKRLVS
jgi:hypothetical protein